LIFVFKPELDITTVTFQADGEVSMSFLLLHMNNLVWNMLNDTFNSSRVLTNKKTACKLFRKEEYILHFFDVVRTPRYFFSRFKISCLCFE